MDSRTEILQKYFTSTNTDIYGMALPQELAGALLSRLSRSSKSLRDIFLDEFYNQLPIEYDLTKNNDVAVEKARQFYDRVLVGFGDDSIAQLAGAHLVMENISNLAVNYFEDARLGLAPLERSSRYVDFGRKNENKHYAYYIPAELLGLDILDKYCETLDHSFATYNQLRIPLTKFLQKQYPLDEFLFTDPTDPTVIVPYKVLKKESHINTTHLSVLRDSYNRALNAYVADNIRALLPLATTTTVGFLGVGQAWEYWLGRGQSHAVQEVRQVSTDSILHLQKIIPSLVKRTDFHRKYFMDYNRNIKNYISQLGKSVVSVIPEYSIPPTVEMVQHSNNLDDVITAILYPHYKYSFNVIKQEVQQLSRTKKQEIFDAYTSTSSNRRHKLGRALEHQTFTFDIALDIGATRDLWRHRIMTKDRQLFSTYLGYYTPPLISEAGGYIAEQYQQAQDNIAKLYATMLYNHSEQVAQYCVTFGYRARMHVQANLRQLGHLCALRSIPAGHEAYREVAQEIARQVTQIEPMYQSVLRYVDYNQYKFGRLQSEIRSSLKQLQQKE